ncbi:Aste57867_1069 [Aphanomyces stellatus]|uniref:Aste57867_1069 protein n=1 Tax=Aphanomyces stellatus TaxID=120398 RepID=A0A485K5B7_9STRA|nr:hypothetical protein As57867_001068 [Aphanomyces stellatus]VFT78291.1 Aste57867_1069 [Aphanomyces stellatus]
MIQAANAAIDKETEDEIEAHVLRQFEKDDTLYYNDDGNVDGRCQAVLSGKVTFNADGSIDKRCSAYNAVVAGFRSVTKDLNVPVTALVALKRLVRLGELTFTQSGAVDKRCKSVKSGCVVVTE